MFTSWYGQASCTAGRASFMTGRIPIRSALSIVVARRPERPSQGNTDDRRILQKERLLDVLLGQMASWRQARRLPDRARLRRDESLRCVLPGRLYLQRHLQWFHPWFPSYNADFKKEYFSIVNMCEWEGVAGKPAKKVAASTTTTWPTSISGRLIMPSNTSRRTRRTTSPSSWTSIS